MNSIGRSRWIPRWCSFIGTRPVLAPGWFTQGDNGSGCGHSEPVDHAIGRSRGGPTTKIHLACDGHGRPLTLVLTAGNVNDCSSGFEDTLGLLPVGLRILASVVHSRGVCRGTSGPGVGSRPCGSSRFPGAQGIRSDAGWGFLGRGGGESVEDGSEIDVEVVGTGGVRCGPRARCGRGIGHRFVAAPGYCWRSARDVPDRIPVGSG